MEQEDKTFVSWLFESWCSIAISWNLKHSWGGWFQLQVAKNFEKRKKKKDFQRDQ